MERGNVAVARLGAEHDQDDRARGVAYRQLVNGDRSLPGGFGLADIATRKGVEAVDQIEIIEITKVVAAGRRHGILDRANAQNVRVVLVEVAD